VVTAQVFCSGAVDCMSSVTFWPFVAAFPPVCVIALSVGEVSEPEVA
jgi:hypothetical protein